jgi:trk system potassium uptake protein TrkH
MNWKLILRILGILLFIEAGMLFLCAGVGLFYQEKFLYFVWSALVAIIFGTVSQLAGRHWSGRMGRKDCYMTVTLSWLVFSLVGMLPFLLSGSLPDISSAFFESMSGFTSTGATVIDNCDAQLRGILVWRSLSQWVGGIGIIFFTIAILPAFGMGEVKLFAVEATGPLQEKVHPRISTTARWIGAIYLIMTLLCACTLMLCGMNLFDAFNYALVTAATGGFGTHSDLLRDVYHSPAIEYAFIFFMFVAGINYTLIYHTILRGRIRQFFHDAELRCYLVILMAATALCTLALFISRIDWNAGFNHIGTLFLFMEQALRDALFTTVSLQTTTGLATCDYTYWPLAVIPVLLFIMFAGACSGSTSSGFKCVRWFIILGVVRNELQKILHPRAVLPVRMNDGIVSTQIVQTLFAFTALFVASFFGGAFILALFGVSPTADAQIFDYYDALGISIASLSNVGPGMGYYGPLHSWSILAPVSKITCAILMLIGRLEIFPVLILFTAGFWKKS